MQSIRHYPGLTDMQFAAQGGKQINIKGKKIIPGPLCRKKHEENMNEFWVPGRQTINGIGVNLLMPLSKPCALAGGNGKGH